MKSIFLAITQNRSSISMSKKKTRPWRYGEPLTDEEFHDVRYATRMWLLQERVPLSFVEARIFLHEEKPETLEEIALRFGLSIEDVLRSEPEIRKKVEEAMDDREIFFGHTPIYPS